MAEVKLSDVKAGDAIEIDAGFPCREHGAVLVEADLSGELYFACVNGRHYLEGQLDCEDGDTLAGVVRHEPAPRATVGDVKREHLILRLRDASAAASGLATSSTLGWCDRQGQRLKDTALTPPDILRAAETLALDRRHAAADILERIAGASHADPSCDDLSVDLALRLADAEAEAAALRAQLNTPELHDFAAGVVSEGQHQRARWGVKHDAGKTAEDWFWLVGYLAGKALHAAKAGDTGKALHHTISTAAALGNWHAALSGANTDMRPGIDPAKAEGVSP